MISPEVRNALDSARTSLSRDPEWSMMNALPRGSSGPHEITVPPAYAEFLRLADGGIFGRVVAFSSGVLGRMQFYADDVSGAPVRLGRDSWFCFGKVNEDPLFLHRGDGNVWGFPERGVVWWQNAAFQPLAADLDEFLSRGVLGAGYLTLSGASADDQWWRLLQFMERDR